MQAAIRKTILIMLLNSGHFILASEKAMGVEFSVNFLEAKHWEYPRIDGHELFDFLCKTNSEAGTFPSEWKSLFASIQDMRTSTGEN